MFFTIGINKKDSAAETHKFGPHIINVDAGWHTCENSGNIFLFKGYADESSLDSILNEIQQGKDFTGNFCVLLYNKNDKTLSIKSDFYRSFPLYANYVKNIISNFEITEQQIWADEIVSIDKNGSLIKSKKDVIGQIETDILDSSEVIDLIDQRLINKTKSFLKNNNLPIKTFLSGGVDTLLVFSLLDRETKDYELVNYAHFEFDKFWLHNESEITKNWSYRQMHHWKTPCVLTSGAPGDELMLRSPTTANMYLLAHNSSIAQRNLPEMLHYQYFNRAEHKALLDQQTKLKTSLPKLPKEKLHYLLCNNVMNDFQHHHIGNTITWTPLRDIEIFKLLLRLPFEDACGQIFDSEISKQIISKNSQELVTVISDQKNYGNSMKNLLWLYDKYSL